MAVTEAGAGALSCDFEKVVSNRLKGVAVQKFVVLFNPDISSCDQADFQSLNDSKGVFVAGLAPGTS